MNIKVWRTLLHRARNTNKYDYGHVLVVGGSEAMTGAPILAGRAALRVGAGLITIASTESAVKLIDRDIEEVMTLSLPPWEKTKECLEVIRRFISEHHVSVLAVGPGLPHTADEVVRNLISLELPMVVDAEAFTALSDHLDVLETATDVNKDIVMTPHPGEYTRMTHNQAQYKNGDKLSVKKFAQDYDVTLVFKQCQTLVADAHGELYENQTGNPGLATAGSGDVLTGIIAGLIAQKRTSIYQAACMAVYLHGLAADLAVKSKTEPGMIASDVIEALPSALLSLEEAS